MTEITGIRVRETIPDSDNVSRAVVSFARQNRITQIYVSNPDEPPWRFPWKRSLAQEVVRLASDTRVVVVSNRR